jgi:hypothetical protein
MTKEMYEGVENWTAVCRRDETVTIGTQLLWNKQLVDWRYWNLFGLIVY